MISFLFKFKLNLLFEGQGTRGIVSIWMSEDNSEEYVIFFYHMGPRDCTWLISHVPYHVMLLMSLVMGLYQHLLLYSVLLRWGLIMYIASLVASIILHSAGL